MNYQKLRDRLVIITGKYHPFQNHYTHEIIIFEVCWHFKKVLFRNELPVITGSFGSHYGIAWYNPFQNHYTHEIIIFELFRGLQLQLPGVF